MENSKIEHRKKYAQSFEELDVWQKAQDLAVEVYKTTKIFPSDELYGITSQLRRASSSISANIAEGFGRSGRKDKAHFMTIAYGSLLETKNFLYLAARLGYIHQQQLDECTDKIVVCQKVRTSVGKALQA